MCDVRIYECMSCDVRARNVHDSILYSTLIYRSPLSVSLSFLPLVLFTSFGQKSFEFSSLHLYSKVTKLLVYNTWKSKRGKVQHPKIFLLSYSYLYSCVYNIYLPIHVYMYIYISSVTSNASLLYARELFVWNASLENRITLSY